MASSSSDEDEPATTASGGFSLRLSKINAPRRHRHGFPPKTKPRTQSQSQPQPQPQPSLHPPAPSHGPKARSKKRPNGSNGTTTTTAINTVGTDSKKRRTAKRSRNGVLSNLSINRAKTLPIPIPSFKMMAMATSTKLSSKKTGDDDSHKLRKLNRLERAFFDEDDKDEDDDEDAGATNPFETNNKVNLSTIAEHDTDETETESEHSDFEQDHRPKPKRTQTDPNPKPSPGEHELSTAIATATTMGEAKPTDQYAHKEMETSTTTSNSMLRVNSGSKLGNQDETTEDYNDDSNAVDFGGDCDDDASYECNRLSGDEPPQETATITINASSLSGPAHEPSQQHQPLLPPPSTSNEQPSPSALVGLEREIDRLFLETDTNTITLKLFCKALQHRIGSGQSLDKETKKKVKARVLSLLNGETTPSVDDNDSMAFEPIAESQKEPNDVTLRGNGKVDPKANENENENANANATSNTTATTLGKGNKKDKQSKTDHPSTPETQPAVLQPLGTGSKKDKGSKTDHPPTTETQPAAFEPRDGVVVSDEQSSACTATNNSKDEPTNASQTSATRFDAAPMVDTRDATAMATSDEVIVVEDLSLSTNPRDEVTTTLDNEPKASTIHTRFNAPPMTESQPVAETRVQVTVGAVNNPQPQPETQKARSASPNPVTRQTNSKAKRQPKRTTRTSQTTKRSVAKKKPEADAIQRENPETGTNPKNGKPQPKATASGGKRPRKTKPKDAGDGDDAFDSNRAASGAPAPKKQNQPRKRTRKAQACALCKTCPCQRTHTSNGADNVVVATLEMNTFSRSDGAIEKTLIRRLQKLEKSSENLEEQTEIVRRRLKKHRRDMWKRAQRERDKDSAGGGNDEAATAGGIRTADSYFLPDAEVFERLQDEGRGLPRNIVEKARSRVFQSVPTYQPTLFEVMGIPRDGDKMKHKTDNEANEDKGDECNDNMEIACKEKEGGHDHNNNDDNADDDDIPTEYVPERETIDRIHRLEWENGVRKYSNEETGVVSGSIFDTILAMTQDQPDKKDNITTAKEKSLPLWDDLFEPNDRGISKAIVEDEAGLDDLVGLFEKGETDSTKTDSDSNHGIDKDNNHVDLGLLSQGAQVVANEMVSNFSSQEKGSIEMLERSCPNWKENIYFALSQKDPVDITQALESVRESKMHIQAQKKRILDAWESKNAALELFETALKRSADRLKSNGASDDATVQSTCSISEKSMGDNPITVLDKHTNEGIDP